MTANRQALFGIGFLTGVIFTVSVWRTFEDVYVREILAIPQGQSAPAVAPAATPKTKASSVVSSKITPAWFQGPESAPVTLIEYSDFFCPFCARGSATVNELMGLYPDKIKRIWKHFPLPMHAGADRWHEAAECAGDQGRFWDFHHEIFEHQSEVSQSGFNPEMAAAKLGLNGAVFSACVESRKYKDKVQNDIREGNEKGIRGTPYFSINGEAISGAYPLEHFKAYVEHALDPSKPLPRKEEPKAPPEPKEVNFTDLKGRPSLGPEKAPVTIVEFSDFHCPFCKRASETMDQVMKHFDGKVRRVWRHFPLPMHQGADETHEASECAHDQDKFWQFHDQIFSHQQELQDKTKLEEFAKAAGLNLKKWKKCVEGRQKKSVVESDLKKGRDSGINGTPAFYINGKPFIGARPFDQFEQAISEELQKKK